MVRVSSLLCRVPVIKFRKGGGGGGGHAAAAAASAPAASVKPGSCPVGAAAPQAQPAAAMSTSIPDIDLPARYRRQPLSEEEIAHINGGGVV